MCREQWCIVLNKDRTFQCPPKTTGARFALLTLELHFNQIRSKNLSIYIQTKTMPNPNTNTNTKTMTNTFREHLQRAISETFDRWDIWSEWSRKHDLTNKKTMTIREHLQSAISGTFDRWDILTEQWENMTWPTTKNNEKDKDKDKNDNKYTVLSLMRRGQVG